MSEKILSVSDVSLVYKEISSINYREIFKLNKRKEKKDKTYTALYNVNFEINKGDCLGVVGANGAGKSTLLRVLAGVYKPDRGIIEKNCDTTSLLSLGIGFQSRLSGRKNIYLSGLALGFTMNRIKELEQDIIDFSELEAFIDKPVKTYSSGMYSKLSFAISVMLECDLLLIDEVLSVGDIRFRKKSSEKLKSVIGNEHQTVVIVSHASASIKELCNKVLWLDKGELIMMGNTDEVLGKYLEFMNK